VVRKRSELDAADLVVLVTTAVLGVLCGLGGGFVFWSVMVASRVPRPWNALAYVLSLGLVFTASRAGGGYLRLALALCALSLLLSFALGDRIFAPLFGG
jgi:NhaP-type Na+/H+ and K+/H+ antiporter